MPEPILPPITTDPDEIAALAFDELEASIPGWNRARADAMYRLIIALARMVAEARDTAAEVPLAILRYLGQWIAQLAPVEASAATTTTTVTMVDDAGYTVHAGDRFEVKVTGDESHIFLAAADVTVAPGDTATAAGEVDLIAETPGADASGLLISSVVVPVDALAFIDSVVLTAATSGGEDAETDEEYDARLIEEFELITGTPVLPDDFAVLARRIPGVGRSLAVNLYDPALDTYGHERTVAVALTDDQGEPVSAGTKTEVKVYLESLRELNFVVWPFSANYTTIKVTAAVVTYAGWDTATVDAAVTEALTAYLSPATAAQQTGAVISGVGGWYAITTIRRDELVTVANNTEGVDYVSSLTLAETSGTLSTADVVLVGPASLPRPGSILVSAVAP